MVSGKRGVLYHKTRSVLPQIKLPDAVKGVNRFVKNKRILTKTLCLLLSLSMAAGTVPTAVFAEDVPADAGMVEIVSEAIPEATAVPEATVAPENTETPEATETPETTETPEATAIPEATAAPAPAAAPATAEADPELSENIALEENGPAKGDKIVIGGITYEISSLPTATSNGKLKLTDGKSVSGSVTLADGLEYEGGRYDVVELGHAAFMGNTAVTGVDLSATSVKKVGQNCFRNCTALTLVKFSESGITNLLSTGVFAGCTSLTSLEIRNANISGKSPFSGSSIRTLTIHSFSGSVDANEFSGMPEGLTLNCPGSLGTGTLNANAFGTTKNVTLNVATQELKTHYSELFAGKSVTVKLLGGEEESVATVTDSTGTLVGYPSLEAAIGGINVSADPGPFALTMRAGGPTVQWPEGLVPNKATVIDFFGCSVDLPETLTLAAPLTIKNVTNFVTDSGLCTVNAGAHAFAVIDGGSFGFAEISGSDLYFEGVLPGGGPMGPLVRLVGEGDNASVTFAGIGRSEYYYDLPSMSGFAGLTLENAYLQADASDQFTGQLAGVKKIAVDEGGLKLFADTVVETLSGSGELRFEKDGALKVTASATGEFTLPDVTGAGGSLPLEVPAGSAIKLTGGDGSPIEPVAAAVSVSGLGGFESLTAALQAIEAAAGEAYTITLNEDAALEAADGSSAFATVELPAKKLTIDGNGHALAAGGSSRNYVRANGDLTLKNVELAMPKTYLEIGASAAITVEGTVTGELEKISADVAEPCTVVVNAPVSDKVIDGISGTSSNELTVIAKGYGSSEAPAARAEWPNVSNNSGTLVLENSWVVADYAANWGAVEVSQAGGLSVTGTMPYATVDSWKVRDGAVADLIVKDFSTGLGCLKVLGEVSGKTRIILADGTAPEAGSVPVEALDARSDSFILTGAEGMELVRTSSGDYVLRPTVIADPAATVTGGTMQEKAFASVADALDAVAVAAVEGAQGTFTVALCDDLVLNADLTLPNAALVLDGAGHSVTAAARAALNINVPNDLTLRNLTLDLASAVMNYKPQTNDERRIVFENTVKGQIDQIRDDSGSRWLDICIETSGLAFNKIVGNTSSNDTRLTDLYLTGIGTEQAPVDLTGKVENMAAVELYDCWLTGEGDLTGLGKIRIGSAATSGAFVITGDATVAGFVPRQNARFQIRMPADKTLNVTDRYSYTYPVPLYLTGTPAEGHVLVKAPMYYTQKDAMFELANGPEGVSLYWDRDALQFVISMLPTVSLTADSVKGKEAYTSVGLQLADGNGLDYIMVNDTRVEYDGETSATYKPQTMPYVPGTNTVKVYDVTGTFAQISFEYQPVADYSGVAKALSEIPADLSVYTDASVQALNAARNSVVYGLESSFQGEVDDMASAIRSAIAALQKKPAGGSGDSGSAPAATPAPAASVQTLPQTGDVQTLGVWTGLLLAALAGAAGLEILLRKRRGQR